MPLTRRVYPTSPVVGVAAMIFYDDSILLVKRGNEPAKGRWGLPGGVVELGETVREAVAREVKEETGILVRPVELLDVFNNIIRDDKGRVRFHYVLCEFLCENVGGNLKASTDVSDARWVPLLELSSIDMSRGTKQFISRVRSKISA
jgi:8-oxo-dGTP diphosphatase